MDQLLLTRKEVEQRCRIGTSTLYRLIRFSDFPKPVKIGSKSVRWPVADIEAWIVKQPRQIGPAFGAAASA